MMKLKRWNLKNLVRGQKTPKTPMLTPYPYRDSRLQGKYESLFFMQTTDIMGFI